MKKFRIPRKVKKEINKGISYFFPPDKNGNREIAFPKDNQEHYIAWKRGELDSFWSNIGPGL